MIAGMITASGARSACNGLIRRVRRPVTSARICGQNRGNASNAVKVNVGRHPKFAAMHKAPKASRGRERGLALPACHRSDGLSGRREVSAPSHSQSPSDVNVSDAANGI